MVRQRRNNVHFLQAVEKSGHAGQAGVAEAAVLVSSQAFNTPALYAARCTLQYADHSGSFERTAFGCRSTLRSALIVVLNEKLLEVMGDDVTQDQAFAHANDVLKNAVGGISDIIHIPGLVNVDFEDVKTVMSEPGKAMMGTAVAGGPDRATKAADLAVACPLLEGIDLSGARGVLVLIAASKQTFKLAESRNAMNTIRRYAAEDAHVIFGTAYDDTLGDQLRVTVIATGLSSVARQGQHRPEQRGEMRHDARHDMRHEIRTAPPLSVVQPQQQLRTGTDNLPILNQVAQPQQHNYEGMNTPSVWRSARSHAAAKVDALASNGMDEIEIPAFLRKQAD